MSTRALASITGVSQSTAARDVRGVRAEGDVRHVRGLDGKLYVRDGLTAGQVAGLAHELAHNGDRSTREVRDRLAELGILRSVGAVHGYLTRYTCPDCEGTTR